MLINLSYIFHLGSGTKLTRMGMEHISPYVWKKEQRGKGGKLEREGQGGRKEKSGKTDREEEEKETNGVIREKGSGPNGPCPIMSSISSFQIPVLSSGRFCH
jgi:hypothetical protein